MESINLNPKAHGIGHLVADTVEPVFQSPNSGGGK